MQIVKTKKQLETHVNSVQQMLQCNQPIKLSILYCNLAFNSIQLIVTLFF